MPTGGKSIIYSVGAIVQGGIHIVIELLESLMEEQVKKLRAMNIIAYFINSSVETEQLAEIINILSNASLKYAILLFTSPEWLQSPKLEHFLKNIQQQNKLKYTFIDEAHCVSLWAGSFMSSCSKFGFLKTSFDVPVTALSGSATDHAVSVIKESLQMNTDPEIVKMSFKCTNLTVNFTWKLLNL